MNTLLEVSLTNALFATLLAVVALLITRVWRHPAIVHALWIIVLVKLVTPPLVAISWQWPSASAAPSVVVASIDETPPSAAVDRSGELNTSTTAEIEAPDQVDFGSLWQEGSAIVAPDYSAMPFAESEPIPAPESAIAIPGHADTANPARINWRALVFCVWLGGSVFCLLVAAARLIGFHHALLQTAPAAGDLQQLACGVAEKLGVTRPFRVQMTTGRLAPLVWPIGRPTIVLSHPLIDQLSHDEIRMLLAHELAHLRRNDHWVRWLELAVTILYWWHPVVWFARKKIHRAEEHLCDAWTVWAFPAAARNYAEALFKAVQFASEGRRAVPIVASRLSAGGDLKERIEHIMNATWNHRLGWSRSCVLLAAAIVVLPLSLRAQQASTEKKTAATAVQEATAVKADTTAVREAMPSKAIEYVQEEIVLPDGKREVQIRKVPATTGATATFIPDAPTLGPQTAALTNPSAGANAELLKVWRDQIIFLETQAERSKALLDAGAEGGSREDYELALYEMKRVQAEAAIAQGKPNEAVARLEEAVKHADAALQALDARRSAGAASAESVFQAARKLYDARRSLILVRAEALRRTTSLDSTQATKYYYPQPAVPWVSGAPIGAVAAGPPVVGMASAPVPYRISPGDAIQVSVIGVAADVPINNVFYVEPAGTIALGPAYGRVKVAGLSLEDAEKALKEHLEKTYDKVQLQITLPRPPSLSSTPRPQAAPPIAYQTATPAAPRSAAPPRDPRTAAPQTAEANDYFDYKSIGGTTGGRVDVARELAQMTNSSAPTESLGVLRTIVLTKQRAFERVTTLAKQNSVSASEVDQAKAEMEISVARLKQAERGLLIRKTLVALAEMEFAEAMEANKRAPNSVTSAELRRLDLLVELAKLKYDELAE